MGVRLRYILLVLFIANVGYLVWSLAADETASPDPRASVMENAARPLINTGLIKVAESDQQ